jgi:hypothetical protein
MGYFAFSRQKSYESMAVRLSDALDGTRSEREAIKQRQGKLSRQLQRLRAKVQRRRLTLELSVLSHQI